MKSLNQPIKTEDGLVCTLCKFCTSSTKLFNQHVKRVHQERTFSCSVCEKKFALQKDVNRHIKKVHESVKEERVFTCDICNAICSNVKQLKQHKKVHEPPKSPKHYVCNICGKSYPFAFNLNRHKLKHASGEKLKCSVPNCNRWFSLKSKLEEHLEYHKQTPPKTYSCDVCGKTFLQTQALVRHKRIHTGERPYSCAICLATFADASVLRRHKESHTKGKLDKCSKFAQTASVFKSRHNKKPKVPNKNKPPQVPCIRIQETTISGNLHNMCSIEPSANPITEVNSSRDENANALTPSQHVTESTISNIVSHITFEDNAVNRNLDSITENIDPETPNSESSDVPNCESLAELVVQELCQDKPNKIRHFTTAGDLGTINDFVMQHNTDSCHNALQKSDSTVRADNEDHTLECTVANTFPQQDISSLVNSESCLQPSSAKAGQFSASHIPIEESGIPTDTISNNVVPVKITEINALSDTKLFLQSQKMQASSLVANNNKPLPSAHLEPCNTSMPLHAPKYRSKPENYSNQRLFASSTNNNNAMPVDVGNCGMELQSTKSGVAMVYPEHD